MLPGQVVAHGGLLAGQSALSAAALRLWQDLVVDAHGRARVRNIWPSSDPNLVSTTARVFSVYMPDDLKVLLTLTSKPLQPFPRK